MAAAATLARSVSQCVLEKAANRWTRGSRSVVALAALGCVWSCSEDSTRQDSTNNADDETAATTESKDASAATSDESATGLPSQTDDESPSTGPEPLETDPAPGAEDASTPVPTTAGSEDETGTADATAATDDAGAVAPRTPDDECQAPHAGTRLRPVGQRGKDGSLVSHAWYDEELDIYCLFALAEDGVSRCLPYASPTTADGQLYADAECTQIAVAGWAQNEQCPADLPTPRYSLSSSPAEEACAPRSYQVQQVGEALAVQQSYSLQSDGQCVPWSTTIPLFELGDAVPPETFVGVESVEAVGDRIQIVRRTASDGSVDYSKLYAFDAATGTACHSGLGADGAIRCLPFQDFQTNQVRYADAACTQAVGTVESTRCGFGDLDLFGSSNIYLYAQTDPCTPDAAVHIYETGAAEDAVVFSELYATESCYGSSDNTMPVAPVGPEVPPQTFIAGTQELAA